MILSATTTPVVHDREAMEEFADILREKAMELAQLLSRLRQTPGDQRILDAIFQNVHTIKGEASVSKVDLAVIIVHPLEGLLVRYRSGELVFSELATEVFLLAMDRLELAVEAILRGDPLEDLRLVQLVQYMERAVQAQPPEVPDLYADLIKSVTGYPTLVSEKISALPEKLDEATVPISQDVGADLQFFRTLGLQLENYSLSFRGRTTRILRLALETNRIAPNPVNPVQLEAAIYLHDLGMMIMPEHVWLKRGHLTAEERLSLRAHPSFGAGLLKRMPNWEPAAEMVAQHHEMPNGTGYPDALKLDKICHGARLIAIVDAFESIVLRNSQAGRNISVLRAISEINACSDQFAPELVKPFNTVIRSIVERPAK